MLYDVGGDLEGLVEKTCHGRLGNLFVVLRLAKLLHHRDRHLRACKAVGLGEFPSPALRLAMRTLRRCLSARTIFFAMSIRRLPLRNFSMRCMTVWRQKWSANSSSDSTLLAVGFCLPQSTFDFDVGVMDDVKEDQESVQGHLL